ncbi:hypothetical protein BDV93DRAFT_261597 [Ceratobasidium sp. AG-I]|nr:hypothetical protein BDV93DRAFT_261597 [Ceratobasidium sp. AG-I]
MGHRTYAIAQAARTPVTFDAPAYHPMRFQWIILAILQILHFFCAAIYDLCPRSIGLTIAPLELPPPPGSAVMMAMHTLPLPQHVQNVAPATLAQSLYGSPNMHIVQEGSSN